VSTGVAPLKPCRDHPAEEVALGEDADEFPRGVVHQGAADLAFGIPRTACSTGAAGATAKAGRSLSLSTRSPRRLFSKVVDIVVSLAARLNDYARRTGLESGVVGQVARRG